MQRLRELEVCLVAGDRAIWVAKGQVVCVRPWGGTSGVEWQAGLQAVAWAQQTLAPEAADDLRVLASFIRRPPPELTVVQLRHFDGWRSYANARSETPGGSSWSTESPPVPSTFAAAVR
jgi:hypothetical protein